MAPRTNIRDKENDKFCRISDKKVAVRVCGDPNAIPIPVTFDANTSNAVVKNFYGEALSVATSVLTSIVSHTVPVGKTFELNYIEVSGGNIAKFTVLRDTATIGKKVTYWCDFNQEFKFGGLEFAAGEKIEVKVIHERSASADFEARINGVERG